MLRKYQNMFASVADVMETFSQVQHPPNHPTLQSNWNEDFQTNVDSIMELAEVEATEKQAFERVQDIFTKGLKIFLEEARTKSWSELSEEQRKAKIQTILSCPQIPQRTLEWYQQGQELLTASEFASLYGTERTYANLVLAKATQFQPRAGDIGQRSACLTCEMGPFDWGIRFEPVVKHVFENFWKVKISECGRITHGTDKQLAASPDGIFTEAADLKMLGRLIEIKCPISRPIGNGVPFEYWCQMQIQMEVCDVDECQYIEVKLQSAQARKPTPEPVENPFATGNVFILEKDEGFYAYAYNESSRDDLIHQGYALKETVPWSIVGYHTEIVQRDRKWFESTAPLREKFWQNVEAAKQGTFKLPPPVTPRQKACLIVDSPPSPLSIQKEQTPVDIQ
jgi:hypothetical protein